MAGLLQISSVHADEQTAQADFTIWYQRAVLGSVSASDAMSSDEPIKIYKWYGPLRIKAYLDDPDTHHGPELQAYLQKFLGAFTDTTNLTAALIGKDAEGDISPNVLIFVGSGSVAESVKEHQDEITAMMGDGGKMAKKLLSEAANSSRNCAFGLHKDGDDEITKGLVFVPVAEDSFATKKCLGHQLLAVIGLLGANVDSESVIKRNDAAILPTDDDKIALKIQYLRDIEGGVTPSAVLTAIGQAMNDGSLP